MSSMAKEELAIQIDEGVDDNDDPNDDGDNIN